MTPRRFDRAVLAAAVGLIAVFLLIALAGEAHASHSTPWHSEVRAEREVLVGEGNLIGMDPVLCLGIGRKRGARVLRFRKFVCSGLVYPDTLVIIRVSYLPNGGLMYG
jgi:hypothetical protein